MLPVKREVDAAGGSGEYLAPSAPPGDEGVYEDDRESSDDDGSLVEVATQGGGGGGSDEYAEYLLRVVPWTDWDKLFGGNESDDGEVEEGDGEEEPSSSSGPTATGSGKGAWEAEFRRREYLLARFASAAPQETEADATSRRDRSLSADALFATQSPSHGASGGLQFAERGFARLCREGEETVRLRREALAEEARMEQRRRNRVGSGVFYSQRRDMEGIANIPPRYRKKVILEVEEGEEEESGGKDARRASPPSANPDAERRRVYHGTMDSAQGSDYCLMIMRDDHTVDLIPTGRYSWYNFKFSHKLSAFASKRAAKRQHWQAVRQARTAAAEESAEAEPADDDGAAEELNRVERRLRARTHLQSVLLENRRNFFEAHTNQNSALPVARESLRVSTFGDAATERSRPPDATRFRGATEARDAEAESEVRAGVDEQPGRWAKSPRTVAREAATLVDATDWLAARDGSTTRPQRSPSLLDGSERSPSPSASPRDSNSSLGDDALDLIGDGSGASAAATAAATGTDASLTVHLTEQGRALQRLLDRERRQHERGERATDTGEEPFASQTSTTAQTEYGASPEAAETAVVGSKRLAPPPSELPAASSALPPLPPLPPHTLPDRNAPIEEAHLRAALHFLHQQRVPVTVRDFLSYFTPWFPSQKARVGALIKQLCVAREMPPGSKRVYLFLRDDAS